MLVLSLQLVALSLSPHMNFIPYISGLEFVHILSTVRHCESIHNYPVLPPFTVRRLLLQQALGMHFAVIFQTST